MTQDWYYDFVNLGSAVSQALIKDGKLPYFKYIKDIINTKVSMFEIKNIERIPDLTNQILFGALMFQNCLCFYNNIATGGWILCRYVIGSEFNYYYKPVKVNLIALNGQPIAFNVPYNDIVLVRDNKLDIIPFLVVNEYIEKIQKVEDSTFKILNVASLPLVLVGSKKMSTTLKAIAKSLGSKESFIAGDDSLPDVVKAFDIKVPINPLDTYELKNKYKNECLSSLGIYSVDEKRERLVTQEVVTQNDFTDYVYQSTKMELQRMIKEMNDRDKSLELSLVETYMINVKDNIKEEADMAAAISKAKNKQESKGDE